MTITEEKLKTACYLKGWKLFVWRVFMNYVFEDWKKGNYKHLKLIKSGSIVHLKGYSCPICEQDERKMGEFTSI